MKRLSILLFTLISLSAIGQEVKNINFKQEDDKIIIYYDLIGKDIYKIECYYTIDEGQNFIKLNSVSGEIGDYIYPGAGKIIIWDIFKDTDGIKGEIQFKIIAIGINESRKFYASFGITPNIIYTDDLNGNSNVRYGWTIKAGMFSRKKLGYGVSFGQTSYRADPNYDYTDENINHIQNRISPIVSYKLSNNSKKEIFLTFQTGFTLNEIWITGYSGNSYISVLDNIRAGITLNLGHLHVYADYSFEKGTTLEKVQELGSIVNINSYPLENNHLIYIGLGITF